MKQGSRISSYLAEPERPVLGSSTTGMRLWIDAIRALASVVVTTIYPADDFPLYLTILVAGTSLPPA
jgi:hypothetical protein